MKVRESETESPSASEDAGEIASADEGEGEGRRGIQIAMSALRKRSSALQRPYVDGLWRDVAGRRAAKGFGRRAALCTVAPRPRKRRPASR